MRAKTSEFLKVLNRAKIEEENTKKKTSFMGNRGQFIWDVEPASVKPKPDIENSIGGFKGVQDIY